MSKTVIILDRSDGSLEETKHAIHQPISTMIRDPQVRRSVVFLLAHSGEEAVSLLRDSSHFIPPYFVIANWRLSHGEEGLRSIQLIERAFHGSIIDAVLMGPVGSQSTPLSERQQDGIFLVKGRVTDRKVRDEVLPLVMCFVEGRYERSTIRFSPSTRSTPPPHPPLVHPFSMA